jgi:hypothetical protein
MSILKELINLSGNEFADVFHPSPDIEKALNSAEFIKWLGEQKRAREQGNG